MALVKMRISSAEIARYRAGLDKLASEAGSYVADLHAAMAESYPDASVAEVREAMKDAVDHALNAFGDQASTLACDLFDEIMEAEGVKAESALYDAIDRDMVDKKLRYLARDLVEDGSAAFAGKVTDLTKFYVKRSAYENMVRNCDANKVRYARVPSGRETCGFCFMLSSRGFVYHSEATAKGTHGMHPHCDCVVVPGVQGKTSIEGYDPDAMHGRWRQCARTCGSEGRKAVMREVETRDWRWLYGGTRCNVGKEPGAKPLPKENHVANILAGNGFDVRFVKEVNESGIKTADAWLNGSLWEFKIPERWNDKTVKNQFKKALGKGTGKLLISGSLNGAGLDEMEVEVRRVFDNGEFSEIGQVLIVDKDGSMKRVVRS